jgi:hypothetical protein
MQVVTVTDPDICNLYERRLVLVRPDGHVAWRGDNVTDALQIIDTIRGSAHTRVAAPAL